MTSWNVTIIQFVDKIISDFLFSSLHLFKIYVKFYKINTYYFIIKITNQTR